MSKTKKPKREKENEVWLECPWLLAILAVYFRNDWIPRISCIKVKILHGAGNHTWHVLSWRQLWNWILRSLWMRHQTHENKWWLNIQWKWTSAKEICLSWLKLLDSHLSTTPLWYLPTSKNRDNYLIKFYIFLKNRE